MPFQNDSNTRLSTLMAVLILGLFAVHYAFVLINHFSKDLLPKKYYYATNKYLVPWFYQNLTAFAPEPPYRRHVFVYRLKTNKGWTQWKQPSAEHLENQWQNRFSVSVKIQDQLEQLAEQMYKSGKRSSNGGLLSRNENRYVLDACERYAKHNDLEWASAKQMQSAVYVCNYSVIRDSLMLSDTAYIFESNTI